MENKFYGEHILAWPGIPVAAVAARPPSPDVCGGVCLCVCARAHACVRVCNMYMCPYLYIIYTLAAAVAARPPSSYACVCVLYLGMGTHIHTHTHTHTHMPQRIGQHLIRRHGRELPLQHNNHPRPTPPRESIPPKPPGGFA